MFKKLLVTGFSLVGLLGLGFAFGALNHHDVAQAQENTSQTFVLQAGAGGAGNSEVLAFAPQAVQVHRGDTVTWSINGFHNVHFSNEPTELVIVGEVDGQMVPQINPALAFPAGGNVFVGENLNSGLPESSEPFSVVIDAEPGTYAYMCDIHPGMVGTITVVDDASPIPSTAEVALQASAELSAALQVGLTYPLQFLDVPENQLEVQVGSGDTGRTTVNLFFPSTSVVHTGESITWTIPATSIDPHVVSFPGVYGQDVVPVMRESQPPVLTLGASITPVGESGAEVTAGGNYSSGLMMPGQSYSLTFAEPGLYAYACNIHPGMVGTVVVVPAE